TDFPNCHYPAELSGVVDHDVNTPKLTNDSRFQFANLLPVGHIGHKRRDCTVLALDQALGSPELIFVTGATEDSGSPACQSDSNGPANASPCPGNNHGFA